MMEFYGMSSTSSECECYLCQVGMDCRNARPTPFYPTMGQPLVYYADVPKCRGSRQSKRPNCFVRAFRWYTDDLKSNKRERPNPNPNLGAFATWLDAKYEQFLLEYEDSNTGCSRVNQTSAVESCPAPPACTPDSQSETCCAKRKIFGRHISLRRKRRGQSKSEERRCCDENPKMSMEFILPPKDISRAASECCRVTATSCDSVKQRCAGKSQSLTRVSQNKENVEDETKKPVKFDNPPVEKKSQVFRRSETKEIKPEKLTQNDACLQCSGNIDRNDAHIQCEPCQSTVTVVTKEFSITPNRNRTCSAASAQVKESKHTKEKRTHSPKQETAKTSKHSKLNISCQCPVEPKVDSQIQCEEQDPKSNARRDICLGCRCPDCSNNLSQTSAVRSRTVPQSPLSVQASTLQAPSSAVPQCCSCLSWLPCPVPSELSSFPVQNLIITTPSRKQEFPVAGKCSPNCPYSRSTRCQATECVSLQHIQLQTSDTAINLDPNSVHGYPLYMRIVCADRPTEERAIFAK